ncbi:MAG: hypothetical protein ACRCVV_14740 [Shewanella sp.]|uniref:hypothetical protein n=1 Tax=Aeromonas popoffii TaxID=70856 RepID=UPI003F3436D3
MDRKSQFQHDWLAENWPKFVDEGIEDAHGRLVTVSDALGLTKVEGHQLDTAFRLGACATHEAIEIIAKAYLLDTVVDELWGNHLAAEAEMKRRYDDEKSEMAFENYDMKESAR